MPAIIDSPVSVPSQAPMIGEHPALDLLNTEARTTDGEDVDYWKTGADVLAWLGRVDLDPARATLPAHVNLEKLLSHAKTLRTLARDLILGSIEGSPSADPADLNGYLHAHRSHPHLERDADGGLVLTRIACGEALSDLLGPLAEAVAGFLVEADFSLVKKCEHPDCILWFYDRTRAGRRRWCSMATCGNRHKVARFRKRTAAARPRTQPGTRSPSS